MNKVILIGRLTRDPEIRYNQAQPPVCVAKYSLAVDRRADANGNRQADFISCVCFGKSAEFAERYLHQGMKIAVSGRIQTGSYQKPDGTKVYTTDVVVEEHEFCEKAQQPQNGGYQSQPNSYKAAPKQSSYASQNAPQQQAPKTEYQQAGFMDIIPDSPDAEGLPWN